MADEIARLRARAAKCRWLTDWVTDPQSIESLKEMAEESDAEADRLESEKPEDMNKS
jgi:hypothetical protein